MTATLYSFPLAHVTQATLLTEAIVTQQAQRIMVVRRDQDGWLALERQRQRMFEQPLSRLCCTSNPGTECSGLCDQIACHLPTGIAQDQGPAWISGPIGGEECSSFGSKVSCIERNHRWEVLLRQGGDALGKMLEQLNRLPALQDQCVVVIDEAAVLVECGSDRGGIKQRRACSLTGAGLESGAWDVSGC
jgi:hypothetical protein